MADVWSHGEAYERFMGRWSRLLAPQFLHWLRAPAGLRWADVGCGSGALSTAILDLCSPARLTAVDPSQAQVAEAARQIHDPRVSFGVGTASNLPAEVLRRGGVRDSSSTSSPTPTPPSRRWPGQHRAASWRRTCGTTPRACRCCGRSGTSPASSTPACADLNEGHRFTFAAEDLAELWTAGRTGRCAAPGRSSCRRCSRTSTTSGHRSSVARVRRPGTSRRWPNDAREALRAALAARLPAAPDGTIALMARAWAVRGRA